MKQYEIGIISMIMCCWVSVSYSQTIDWGPSYERSSLFNEQQIVQIKEDGCLVWQYYKDPQYYFKYKALQYDQQGKQQASAAPLVFKYQDQNGQYQANQYKENQWRFYYTVVQEEAGKELLCWTSLDLETLDLESSQQLLSTIDYNKAHGRSTYQIGQSSNQQTLLYGLLPQARKEPGQLFVQVLNAAGQVTTRQQIQVPQEASLLLLKDIQDAFLTTEGTAYLLCKFYHKKSRKEEKKMGIPYHYALLQVTAKGEVTWQDSLGISTQDSSIIVSARLYQAPNEGAIYCVGSYKTPSNGGLFQWAIEQPAAITTLAYPAGLKRKPTAQKSKKITLQTYKIKQWLPQEAGSYLAIAEQQYTKVYWDKSEGQQALHQLHDILLMKWNKQGELLWYHNIAKRQRGGGDGFTTMKETWYSFAAFEQAGQVHVFYNDLPENKQVEPELLQIGYYNQPQTLDCWHYRLDQKTGELIAAQPLEAAKDWLVYPQKIRLLPNGQVLLAALKPTVSIKEKALLRWGKFSL